MERIGVFICHCGRNISSTVDIPRVMKAISGLPNVAHCEDYKYMCSEPGQRLIRTKVSEKKLDRLVIACCSPSLHEETFRKLSQSVGINRYLTEIANIREQCSWVHTEVDKATEKAIAIIKTMVVKTALNSEIQPGRIPLTRRVLVVGGGIAGI
ncbi:MAG: disulfide reductase, partial [bacterium]